MVLKLALAIAAITILTILGLRGSVYDQGHVATTGQDKDSLVEIARRKKAEGQNKTSISEIRIDYGGANMDLDEALRIYSVVIAQPIESKSFALDSSSIRTWYKFRILETLARKNYTYCSTCSPIAVAPQEMGRANEDEFFLDTIGGMLNIEGVEIRQRNNSLYFEPGNRYMMFVNLTPSQVAVLAGGPSGVFKVDKNDTLHSLTKERARLPAEVETHFLTLPQFRSHINR